MPIQSTRLSPPLHRSPSQLEIGRQRLPRPGLKAHPIVTGTAVLALSGTVLVGGVTLAVLAVNLPLYLAALLL
ncbi:hypothetical protein M5E87_15195 [Flavonifractor plautii]|nr:hypothetical protein M5E87_15195 [Flavonifractor plautii]